MKKILRKIVGIIFVLILEYKQFCYADVISIEPGERFMPIAFVIGFIGVIVLITTAISFLELKATIRKQNETGQNSDNENNEKIEKEKNDIQRTFYRLGMLLSITGLIYFGISREISGIVFCVPIILFVISFIVGLNNNKKVSYIICAISVALVCLIGVWVGISNKMINDYNNQFLQYQKKEPSWSYCPFLRYVSDVKELINTAIKSNKSDRKTTIIYQNVSYTSPDELKQLLEKLNTSKKYSLDINYDKNHDYIESITLTSITLNIRDLQKYGNCIEGDKVKVIINEAMKMVSFNDSLIGDELKVNIVYTSEIGQINNINPNNQASITNLIQKIKTDKTYNVEIQNNTDDVYNIIITAND